MWTNSKYDSKCHECEAEILRGDRIVYDIETKKAYCKACGEEVDGQDPLCIESVEMLSSRARENLKRRRHENSSANRSIDLRIGSRK